MQTKKRKLKKWVKITIIILITILFLTLNNYIDNKNIKKCINAGNTKEFCLIKL